MNCLYWAPFIVLSVLWMNRMIDNQLDSTAATVESDLSLSYSIMALDLDFTLLINPPPLLLGWALGLTHWALQFYTFPHHTMCVRTVFFNTTKQLLSLVFFSCSSYYLYQHSLLVKKDKRKARRYNFLCRRSIRVQQK